MSSPAQNGGCPLIRVCSLIRSDTVHIYVYCIILENFPILVVKTLGEWKVRWLVEFISLHLTVESKLAARRRFEYMPLFYNRLTVAFQLLAIIVFSCILSQGYNKRQCLFNNDPNACNYGIVIGIFACLGLIGFLIVDALFANISNVQQRKYLVIADIVFSGEWLTRLLEAYSALERV